MGRNRKPNKSKRARSEEKLFKTLRYIGFEVKLKHLTSHVSGDRAIKDRWHSEYEDRNRQLNKIISISYPSL